VRRAATSPIRHSSLHDDAELIEGTQHTSTLEEDEVIETTAGATPTATRDLDRAMADLDRFGVCILEAALEGEKLAEVRTALNRAAVSDRRYGLMQDYPVGSDDAVANQRVWNLPSHDPVFCELAEHPVAMHFVKQVLGWPALLSGMSANIVSGGGQIGLHRDQAYMPPPWSRPLGVNVGWAVDDFTAENGATCCVLGSNRFDGEGSTQRNDGDRVTYSFTSEDMRDQLVPLEAPAGSAIVMEGRLLHTNGVNTNGEPRAGIFSWYTLPIYLPQENWYLSLNPAVRQVGSETLQTLLGFRPQVLGRINGRDRI
jgi:ectoine hydroxylase-related dioxygenase (phytanoyl-CoA dioxygenase family)